MLTATHLIAHLNDKSCENEKKREKKEDTEPKIRTRKRGCNQIHTHIYIPTPVTRQSRHPYHITQEFRGTFNCPFKHFIATAIAPHTPYTLLVHLVSWHRPKRYKFTKCINTCDKVLCIQSTASKKTRSKTFISSRCFYEKGKGIMQNRS